MKTLRSEQVWCVQGSAWDPLWPEQNNKGKMKLERPAVVKSSRILWAMDFILCVPLECQPGSNLLNNVENCCQLSGLSRCLMQTHSLLKYFGKFFRGTPLCTTPSPNWRYLACNLPWCRLVLLTAPFCQSFPPVSFTWAYLSMQCSLNLSLFFLSLFLTRARVCTHTHTHSHSASLSGPQQLFSNLYQEMEMTPHSALLPLPSTSTESQPQPLNMGPLHPPTAKDI